MSANKVLGWNGSSYEPSSDQNNSWRIKNLDHYKSLWSESLENQDEFWSREANKFVSWSKGFDKVFSRIGSHFEWFGGGELNVSYNCLDRHLKERGSKRALLWEDEKGNSKSYTYEELYREARRFSSVLKSFALSSGDTITLYLSMSPDLVISMLSCARLGIKHNVVFAGFSAESLAARIDASHSKLVITSDGFYRKGKVLELKKIVNDALRVSSSCQNVLVFDRGVCSPEMTPSRDLWVKDLLPSFDELEEENLENFSSEHPLFMLYTSGSTGKPKGLVHTSGGYLLSVAMSSYYLFNLNEKDIFWCTADIGWITGHNYVVYGPLSLGTTVVMYEGAPFEPDAGRLWSMIEKYKVTKFYTAPTALRMCMKEGDKWPDKYNLDSLELLGSVGEPISQSAWEWYFKTIGKEKCPILDTWWQTETGSVTVAPFPGLHSLKPGCASRPFFGAEPVILGEDGEEKPCGKGALMLKRPTPSMARTIHGNHERYEKEYWCEKTGYYKTNDAAFLDEDGELWILGRIDDVINVSGHRLSTMEIESLLAAHDLVAEAACVGVDDPMTGQALSCFIVLNEKACEEDEGELKSQLSRYISHVLGSFARPKILAFVPSLPKTRSGKIMRRTLKSIASGERPKGDLSTLEDPTVFDHIQV